MEYFFYASAFLIALVGVMLGLDLLAHISRYRSYTRQYPTTRKFRGRIWKGTQ